MIIIGRERDLGGFCVRRILPFATHRMVGPFIFFDHMGPANFPAGKGVEVRPHPHISLATVTYLFEGKIRHRDSLGSDQLIEPGAINWMVAGHGIVHSERTPDDLQQSGSRLNGIQCWIALPDEDEDISPSFTHYPKNVIPEFYHHGVKINLLLGNLFGQSSPVKVHSELFYADAHVPEGETLTIPVNDQECAVYVVEGEVSIDNQLISPFSMYVNDENCDVTITATKTSRIMIIGGKSIGERYIYWNFVSSSEEKIEIAKQDWINGPGEKNSRFPFIPTDHVDFIPLPKEDNPKGTIM